MMVGQPLLAQFDPVSINPFLLYGVLIRIAPWGWVLFWGMYTSVASFTPSRIGTIYVFGVIVTQPASKKVTRQQQPMKIPIVFFLYEFKETPPVIFYRYMLFKCLVYTRVWNLR
jgi:hypothetical protein